MPTSLVLGAEEFTGFYGGSIGDTLIPQNLQYYRTSTDNDYVFWWTHSQDAYVPGLKKIAYELQIDTVTSFDSINLQTFGLDQEQTAILSNVTANTFSSNTIGSSTLNESTDILVGDVVEITSGTGVGQIRRISANTSTVISIDVAWTTDPDGTSVFDVYRSNVISYQNGNVAKGYEIEVPSRTLNSEAVLHARVRAVSDDLPVSSYSSGLTFNLLERFDLIEAEQLINNLADYHVYNKDVVKLPEAQRNTLLWKIMKMYGLEFDRALLLKELVRMDNYLTFTRDEQLFDNWGTFFNFVKPASMQPVDYRNLLQCLVDASLVGSTDQAIIDVLDCFTGVDPLVQTVRDIADFFLTTIREQFVTTGTTNTYIVSQPFITTTMQLVREGPTTNAVLTPGLDFFESIVLPGFTTLLTDPSGNTLTVFYEISEPEPLLFDPADRLTFSGLVGLTNGNINVYGTGTSFTSNVNVGDQISDGQSWETIQFITDNAHLTLSNPWPGDTELVPLGKLRYTDSQIPPNTVWDSSTEAFGVLVTIQNSAEFVLDQVLIEQLVNLFLPAHVKVFYVFN